MGRLFSKRKKSDVDLRETKIDDTSSCGLTDYWNGRKHNFNHNFSNNNKSSLARASEFRVTTLLDEGAFGAVALTNHNKTKKIYATKVITKKKIVKNRLVDRVFNEKRILESIDFPFVVRLEHFYQDNSYLYFVMPFVCGGNLHTLIRRSGPLTEENARFLMSETVLAIEYLHKLDLVHRDIKPENILIDVGGHAQLADFGFCKLLNKGRTYTFCGTPDYMAPEILLRRGHGKPVDYWALGVMLYEMIAGRSTFFNRDINKQCENIVNGKYSCPLGFSGDLVNLLRNMLRVDVTYRYGNLANGIKDIKRHRWFKPIDWCAVFHKTVPSPFVPTVVEYTSNFDKPKGRIFLASSVDLFQNEFSNF